MQSEKTKRAFFRLQKKFNVLSFNAAAVVPVSQRTKRHQLRRDAGNANRATPASTLLLVVTLPFPTPPPPSIRLISTRGEIAFPRKKEVRTGEGGRLRHPLGGASAAMGKWEGGWGVGG